MNICLAYVHPGFVRHEFMESVLRMMPRYDLEIIQVESGTNVQKARNDCVRGFLEGDSEYLFFADTDMMWGADVPKRLIACDVAIVSAFYLDRNGFPVGNSWARAGEDRVMHPLGPEDMEGLLEVAGVGMGCCMIRREVIEKLMADPHGVDWPFAVGEIPGPVIGQAISEDINFCLRAEGVGFKSYIASDIPVGHVKTFVLAPQGKALHMTPPLVRGIEVVRPTPESMA